MRTEPVPFRDAFTDFIGEFILVSATGAVAAGIAWVVAAYVFKAERDVSGFASAMTFGVWLFMALMVWVSSSGF